MEIIKLPPGEKAAEDVDYIRIERSADGRYSLITAALVECSEDDDGEGDSKAVIKSDAYASYEEAEAAGIAWASELCVGKLYVETDR